jgi:hypothetical protein
VAVVSVTERLRVPRRAITILGGAVTGSGDSLRNCLQTLTLRQ